MNEWAISKMVKAKKFDRIDRVMKEISNISLLIKINKFFRKNQNINFNFLIKKYTNYRKITFMDLFEIYH